MAAFDDALDLHFLGTATVLLRYGDLVLLTDPNFLHRGERAHLLMRAECEPYRGGGVPPEQRRSSGSLCAGREGTVAA